MRYRGFISYSHADIRSAEWLLRKLQSYRLPRRLASKDERRLGSFFLDRETLAAASDLTDALKEGLAQSEALIVLCSKEAAASKWVNQEIDAFRQARPDGKIITVLAESLTPSADDTTSFPTRLLENNQEPLAADISGRGFDRQLGFLKLVAALTEIPLDDLLQRDAQRRNRRVTAVTVASALIAITMTALAGAAMTAREEARAQRAEAEDLVDFMLGDLRDRLEPVGRLDVLDGVATRSLEYYAQYDDEELTCEQASRKAKALQLNSRVLIDASPDLETIAQAAETKSFTDRLLELCREDSELLLNAAASEFFVGDAWLKHLRSSLDDPADPLPPEGLTIVKKHYEAHRKISAALLETDPDSTLFREELAYGQDNVGVVELYEGNFEQALGLFQASAGLFRELLRKNSDDPLRHADVLDNMSWTGAALLQMGDYERAVQLRLTQLNQYESAIAQFPDDWLLKRQRAAAMTRLIEAYIETGDEHEAIARLDELERLADELTSHDPENQEWQFAQQALAKFQRQLEL